MVEIIDVLKPLVETSIKNNVRSFYLLAILANPIHWKMLGTVVLWLLAIYLQLDIKKEKKIIGRQKKIPPLALSNVRHPGGDGLDLVHAHTGKVKLCVWWMDGIPFV